MARERSRLLGSGADNPADVGAVPAAVRSAAGIMRPIDEGAGVGDVGEAGVRPRSRIDDSEADTLASVRIERANPQDLVPPLQGSVQMDGYAVHVELGARPASHGTP